MMNAGLSRRVSWMMDHFGYGSQQREFRRKANRYIDSNANRRKKRITQITVGSKGEGITNIRESDRDVLFIHKNVICLESNCQPPALHDETTVLTCFTDLCYYGHTFLEVVHQCTQGSFADACIIPIGYKYYLSSSVLSKVCFTYTNEYTLGDPVGKTQGIMGPAVTCTSNGVDFDFVPVLPCYCPSLLQAWSNRPRYHNWPSPELKQRVVSLGAVVAPTSHFQSINKHLEWRICFNTGETELVKSFNDTQIKLYILLKYVKKDILRPVSKEITSYLMKNIVFWMAEFYSQERFNSDTLVDCLLNALEFLRQAIKQNNLPYFMIPQRNLLAGKMLPDQRDSMLIRLGDALYSGPAIVLQCGRLGRALTMVSPERLAILGNTRNMLEMLCLVRQARMSELIQKNMTLNELYILLSSDDIYTTCYARCANIVLPGWRLLGLLGVDIGAIIDERIESVLA